MFALLLKRTRRRLTHANSRRARRGAAVAVLLVLTALTPPRDAAAQTDARLVTAVHLAQDGRADSARAITRELLSRVPVSDTLYPQILYTAAVVSATSPEMEKALRRVVVEYSSSPWVDDALLRLAQLDYANGDVSAAAEKLERLRRDFPQSTLLAPSALWAARSYFELKQMGKACGWLEAGRANAGGDVETANQLAYYAQRCTTQALADEQPTMDTLTMARGDSTARRAAGGAGAAPAAGAARPPAAGGTGAAGAGASSSGATDAGTGATTPAGAPDNTRAAVPPAAPTPAMQPAPSAVAAARGEWRIQVAAVQSDAQAEPILAKLRAAGLDGDLVREGGYVKVRTGRFATRAAADAAKAKAAAATGTQPFVVRQP